MKGQLISNPWQIEVILVESQMSSTVVTSCYDQREIYDTQIYSQFIQMTCAADMWAISELCLKAVQVSSYIIHQAFRKYNCSSYINLKNI